MVTEPTSSIAYKAPKHDKYVGQPTRLGQVGMGRKTDREVWKAGPRSISPADDVGAVIISIDVTEPASGVTDDGESRSGYWASDN